MGVKGLWRLLLPIGRRISIETLEGKVLAIDASIWLTQFLKAMRDPETGSVKPAAHLIGFFRRLAKLRFHGIRPILVFDGATPEIKLREVQQRRRRREQFAATGQASMQRLAKKLLLEQLKKNKTVKHELTSNGGGAFAPTFHPAEEDKVGNARPETTTDSKEEEDKKPAAKERNDSHEAIMAEVADLEEQWAIQESLETENDFDNAVIDLSADQHEETKQSSLYNHAFDVFDVKRISSLPSHERKDAVEEAKRQQRMRSRREFMPVAGEPDKYSQAQLRNFLRSSKLNKEINEMAKQAAGNDDGIGERMASDATRRIVLTRDGDASQQQSPWKRLKKRASEFRTNKLPPEEDDDEEFEWEDGNVVRDKSSGETSASALASDDSGDDSAEGGRGFIMSGAKATSNSAITSISHDGSDATDSNEGGGFMTAFHETEKNKATEAVIGTHSNDEGEDAGGFLIEETTHRKQTGSVTKNTDKGNGSMAASRESNNGKAAETVIEIDTDDDIDEGSASLPRPSVDARRAQELEDELLAKALQEAEDEHATRAEQIAGEKSKKSHEPINGNASHTLSSQLQEAQTTEPKDNRSTDESSDAVEWEDGDKEAGASIDEEYDKKLAAVVRESGSASATGITAAATGTDSDSDEDIAWEDGNEECESFSRILSDQDCPQRPLLGASASASRTKSGKSNGTRATQPHPHSSWDDCDQVNKSSIEMNDFDVVHVVDQNAEALQHAQATASHLTDWAGRAFRRAMAQHAEETGRHKPDDTNQCILTQGEFSPARSDKAEHDDESENMVFDSEPVPPSAGASRASVASSTDKQTQPGPYASDSMIYQAQPTLEPARVSRSENTAHTESFGGLFEEATASIQEQADLFDTESKRKERDMDTITDEMKAEVIQLIQLFGIPYVESPAEAEAQCAKLEELGLVDGIVTEDSDVFVFGGSSVYKNIFDDQKYVEAYLARDAKRDLNLNRNQFIALAMLLGGDYTEGVKGVGIVNGMEVLQAFDCSNNVKDGLSKFRSWLDGFDPDDACKDRSKNSEEKLTAEQLFRRKHKTARTQWVAPKNFPADNVLSAYLKPVVDTSTDRFSWGAPDLDRLLVFCERNMGWNPRETRKLLDPVIERLADTSRQTRLESHFMTVGQDIRFATIKSKRLREVFQGIQKKSSSTTEDKKSSRRKRMRADES